MPNKILSQGAEAIITLTENQIIKSRVPKSYRLPQIDDKIRKLRTRGEAKLLEKAGKIIPVPKVIKSDEKTKEIIMEFIDGKKLSEHLNSFPEKQQITICKQISQNISKLHNAGIIHSDLTTSNMIYVEPLSISPDSRLIKTPNKKNSSLTKNSVEKSSEADFETINRASAPMVYFIDFGLSYQNGKFEDKAVDLHLLKQALEAKHFQNWGKLWNAVEKSYEKEFPADAKKVLERLTAVEKRGRYKH